jgi:hypothetical protein
MGNLYNSYNGRPTTQTVSVSESNGKVTVSNIIRSVRLKSGYPVYPIDN